MKQTILILLAFFLFCAGFAIIYLAAGAVDQEAMGMGQAIIRCIIGLGLLAIDVLLINYLGKEGEYWQYRS